MNASVDNRESPKGMNQGRRIQKQNCKYVTLQNMSGDGPCHPKNCKETITKICTHHCSTKKKDKITLIARTAQMIRCPEKRIYIHIHAYIYIHIHIYIINRYPWSVKETMNIFNIFYNIARE